MDSFSSAYHLKLDDDRVRSFAEWKIEATTYNRSGRLVQKKNLGEWYNKFDLATKKFFSTEPRNP